MARLDRELTRCGRVYSRLADRPWHRLLAALSLLLLIAVLLSLV